MDKSGIDGIHPAVLAGLMGKKMLFKIEKKTAPTAQLEASYRVRRVCEDDAILSMFQLPGAEVTLTKAKFTPPFPEICSLSSDFAHLDSVDAKDIGFHLLLSPVSLGSEGCCFNAKLTPC